MVMVLAVLAPCAVWADVVVMKDGRELEGRIVGETDEAVTLRLRYGEVTVPRSRIAEIRRGPTPLDEYGEKAAAVADTAQSHCELAQWCDEKGLGEEAKHHYRKALEIDPSFTPAGRALGYKEVGGKWLSPDEAKKARGLVKFEGKWIPKEDRDNILAERDEAKQQELREQYGVGPEFHVAKRTCFVLVSDLPEKERGELVRAAGALYAAIEERFGECFVKDRDWPLVIYAFAERDGYRERVKADGVEKAQDSYGYYHGKKRSSYLFRCGSPSTVQMLLHEFTHQIYVERMMSRGARSHAWIFEGLAEYYEGHALKGDKLGAVTPHRINLAVARRAAREETLLPTEKLIETKDLSELFTGGYESEECRTAYAQAWAMVYYLLEADGGKHRQKFLRFMKKDLAGEGTPEEFKKVFGSDLGRFGEKVARFVKGLK